MDFSARGGRPALSEQPAVHQAGQAPQANQRQPKGKGFAFGKLASVLLLLAVSIMLVGLIFLLAFGSNKDSSKSVNERAYVKTSQYQAVFLTGGQVYFGKITSFSNEFVKLTDIFYLRVNQQLQPGQQAGANDITLAKLGGELHGPEDEMFINRSEVQFWENLKDDGRVVKAIKDYQEDPDAATGQTTPTDSTGGNAN